MREVGSKSRGRGSAKLEFLGAVGTRQSWIVSVDNLVICKTVRPMVVVQTLEVWLSRGSEA